MMRRLTKDDEALLREAFRWDAERPQWYREMDRAFTWGDEDQFVALVSDSRYVLIGLFDSYLVAIIIIVLEGYGLFAVHLCASRDADAGMIVVAVRALIEDLLAYDLIEFYGWVAEKHRGLKQICSRIGLSPDGIRMYKGKYRGRLIKWERWSIKREQLVAAKAA
jgi:hypothetical protein